LFFKFSTDEILHVVGNAYTTYDVLHNKVVNAITKASVLNVVRYIRFIHDSVIGCRRPENKGILICEYERYEHLYAVLKVFIPKENSVNPSEKIIKTTHSRVLCADVAVAYSLLASIGDRSLEIWDLYHTVRLGKFKISFEPTHVYILKRKNQKYYILVISRSIEVMQFSWSADNLEKKQRDILTHLCALNPTRDEVELTKMNLSHAGDFINVEGKYFNFEELRSLYNRVCHWKVNRSSGVMGAPLDCVNSKEHFLGVIDAYTMKLLHQNPIEKLVTLEGIGRRFAIITLRSEHFGIHKLAIYDLLRNKINRIADTRCMLRLVIVLVPYIIL